MRISVSGPVGKLVAVGVIVGLATGTSGCKKLLQRKGFDGGVATVSSSGAPKSSVADDPDDQLQEKIDPYIVCLNSLSSAITSSRRRYASLIDYKKGPTGKESWADIYKLPDGEAAKCSTNIAKAKPMPPKNPQLEQAGDDFASTAMTLDPMILEMNGYFESKGYRADKWAKAKEMHPKLVAAFDAFAKADTNLHTTLDGITKPLAQRLLAKIEREDGKRFAYHRKHTLNTARDVIEAADPPVQGNEWAVDVNLLNATFNDFDKTLDELTTYGAAHKTDLADQKKASHWPVADSHYDSFVSAANEYRKAAKNYVRCIGAAPTKTKTPAGKVDLDKLDKCPDGARKDISHTTIEKYNNFIDVSNANQFP